MTDEPDKMASLDTNAASSATVVASASLSRRPPKKRSFADFLLDSSSDEDKEENDDGIMSIHSSSTSPHLSSSSSDDSCCDGRNDEKAAADALLNFMENSDEEEEDDDDDLLLAHSQEGSIVSQAGHGGLATQQPPRSTRKAKRKPTNPSPSKQSAAATSAKKKKKTQSDGDAGMLKLSRAPRPTTKTASASSSPRVPRKKATEPKENSSLPAPNASCNSANIVPVNKKEKIANCKSNQDSLSSSREMKAEAISTNTTFNVAVGAQQSASCVDMEESVVQPSRPRRSPRRVTMYDGDDDPAQLPIPVVCGEDQPNAASSQSVVALLKASKGVPAETSADPICVLTPGDASQHNSEHQQALPPDSNKQQLPLLGQDSSQKLQAEVHALSSKTITVHPTLGGKNTATKSKKSPAKRAIPPLVNDSSAESLATSKPEKKAQGAKPNQSKALDATATTATTKKAKGKKKSPSKRGVAPAASTESALVATTKATAANKRNDSKAHSVTDATQAMDAQKGKSSPSVPSVAAQKDNVVSSNQSQPTTKQSLQEKLDPIKANDPSKAASKTGNLSSLVENETGGVIKSKKQGNVSKSQNGLSGPNGAQNEKAGDSSQDVAVKKGGPALPPGENSLGKPVPKKKKMSFQDIVLQHMLISFRPFTLKTLAQELNTTDTILNHLMLSLVDKNLVMKKEFTSGKGRVSTLYWGNHGAKAKEVCVSMASKSEIDAANKQEAELQHQLGLIQSELATIVQEPSNGDLKTRLEKEESELMSLQRQLEETKRRIQAAKGTTSTASKGLLARGPAKSAAQLARERCPRRMKIRINHMRSEWKSRRDKCMDFIDQLADGMEKKPKEVIKLLDLETDDMLNVKLPPKHVVN